MMVTMIMMVMTMKVKYADHDLPLPTHHACDCPHFLSNIRTNTNANTNTNTNANSIINKNKNTNINENADTKERHLSSGCKLETNFEHCRHTSEQIKSFTSKSRLKTSPLVSIISQAEG